MDRVIIEGNGAIKVDGRYISYKKGVPVRMPESAASQTGKEYKVIERFKKTVISKEDTEKRETIQPDNAYPVHTHAGWYELSNGEKVRGKAKAIEAQNKLD